MKNIEKKINALTVKKKALEEEMTRLKAKKNQALLDLLDTLQDTTLDSYTLIGGLLDVIKIANENTQKKEAWHTAGATFCRKK